MSAQLLDAFTGQPDPGLTAAAKLEAQIDAAFQLMQSSTDDADAQRHWTDISVLIGRRSQTQILKLELERRMRNR